MKLSSVAPTSVARAASAIEIEVGAVRIRITGRVDGNGASGGACGGAVDAMNSVHSDLRIVVSRASFSACAQPGTKQTRNKRWYSDDSCLAGRSRPGHGYLRDHIGITTGGDPVGIGPKSLRAYCICGVTAPRSSPDANSHPGYRPMAKTATIRKVWVRWGMLQ